MKALSTVKEKIPDIFLGLKCGLGTGLPTAGSARQQGEL